MGMNVKERCMIYPAEETPKTSVSLSILDFYRTNFTSNAHSHLLLIYHNPTKDTDFFNTAILKTALSRLLVPFYPVAGRLRKTQCGRRLEIDCNAEGVLFVEVETTSHKLSDFGELMTPNEELKKLVWPTYDSSKGISTVPLLMVQLTRFQCGGVCLDFCHDHHVADGVSLVHVLNSWSRLARKLELTILPFHDRSYLSARNPPVVNFQHLEYGPPLPALLPKDLSGGDMSDTRECIFEVSKGQIDRLKEEAMVGKALSYKLSTFEVLAAHVWRCACKARGLANNQDVKLTMPIDLRARLNPSLPLGYYGNAVLHTTGIAKAEEIMVKPLWHVANIIHEAIIKMNDMDYVRSFIDNLEVNHLKQKPITRAPNSICPNLSINSWGILPFHETDFGWGVPKFVRHGRMRSEGQTFFIPSTKKDGSMEIAIKLFTIHIPLFQEYLYDYFKLLPL